jgi:hypothetical protein
LLDELLFSPNPQVRWQEARDYRRTRSSEELEREIKESYKDWPKFWFGAANAWLVFLGPSPGSTPGKWTYREAETRFRLPSLGKPHEFLDTHDTQFYLALRKWTIDAFRAAGVFDNREAALGSALLANVLELREVSLTVLDCARHSRTCGPPIAASCGPLMVGWMWASHSR